LTLTPLLFEVALAVIGAGVGDRDAVAAAAGVYARGARPDEGAGVAMREVDQAQLDIGVAASDVAFAVKAPLLDISSLPAPPLMPTARVSSEVVAVTSSPPVSVSDRVLLLDLAEAFTVSAPSLRRMSLPLPPSIPTALTAPASEMSCGLESCDGCSRAISVR